MAAIRRFQEDVELRENALKLTPMGRKILEGSYQKRIDKNTIQLIRKNKK